VYLLKQTKKSFFYKNGKRRAEQILSEGLVSVGGRRMRGED
jgi:hypothetical protein